MQPTSLPLPKQLADLIEAKRWPLSGDDVNMQNLRPYLIDSPPAWTVGGERIVLYPSPFSTVADYAIHESFWEEFAAPTEIIGGLAVPIADLGIGADAPIILEYRDARDSPTVKRLKWSGDYRKHDNHWIQLTPSFDSFAEGLDLWNVDWEAARIRYREVLARDEARMQAEAERKWWQAWKKTP